MPRTLTKQATTRQPKLIKVADFSEQSGLARKQVIKLILSGRIKAEKMNPRARNSPWLIPAAELSRYVEEIAA